MKPSSWNRDAAAIARPIFAPSHSHKCRLNFLESPALAFQSCRQHAPRRIFNRQSHFVVKVAIHYSIHTMPIDARSQFISLRGHLFFEYVKQFSRSFGYGGHIPHHLELIFSVWHLFSDRIPHT